MYKYILLFSSCLLFFTSLSLAQEAADAVQATVTKDSSEQSLLWRISGNNLSIASYLYGTIHMIGKEDFFLTDSTRSSFERSERIVFEINMEDMTNMSVLFSLITKVMMEDGVRLKDLLSEEDYALVQQRFSELGLPLMMFERMKPMFLSSFAAGDMSTDGFSSGSVVSYEMEFMEMAKQEEKEMAGLETIEFQMSMFDSIPYKVQAEMLVESLRGGDTEDDQFQIMVDLYKAQDLEGMQALFQDEEGGVGEYEDVLLINRNRNWIPLMAEMMKEKATFFAVGAGHLGGKNGVIQLLRQAGYTLTPLR